MRPTVFRNRLLLMAFGALLSAGSIVGVGVGVGINHDTQAVIQEVRR